MIASVPQDALAMFEAEIRETVLDLRLAAGRLRHSESAERMRRQLSCLRGTADSIYAQSVSAAVGATEAALLARDQERFRSALQRLEQIVDQEFAARLPAVPPEVALHAGQIYAGKGEVVVRTVLGSCVSVCLWDADRRIGAINHYLLPSSQNERTANYGSHAIPETIARFRQAGGRTPRAKLFGGASVIGFMSDHFQTGALNVRIATELLEQAGIPIVERDVGGKWGRRLVFDLTRGSTSVTRI